MAIRTPLGRVLHFGAAHEGTSHFWRQRLTAIANIPLVIAFVIIILTLVGQPEADVLATLRSPLVAIILFLMIVSITTHMRIGMQVIVEDYIESVGLRVVLIVANNFFAALIAVVAGLAIAKLALGA